MCFSYMRKVSSKVENFTWSFFFNLKITCFGTCISFFCNFDTFRNLIHNSDTVRVSSIFSLFMFRFLSYSWRRIGKICLRWTFCYFLEPLTGSSHDLTGYTAGYCLLLQVSWVVMTSSHGARTTARSCWCGTNARLGWFWQATNPAGHLSTAAAGRSEKPKSNQNQYMKSVINKFNFQQKIIK